MQTACREEARTMVGKMTWRKDLPAGLPPWKRRAGEQIG